MRVSVRSAAELSGEIVDGGGGEVESVFGTRHVAESVRSPF
jgi:hypothetical protein